MGEAQPVAEALRAEILKLTTEGDQKSSGALTPEVLARVVRVAKTGRDLLMSLNMNPSNLSGMLKRPNSPFMSFGGNPSDDGLGDLGGEQQPAYTAYAPASQSENFGMTAIREIIAAAKDLKHGRTSPVELVEALALAREEGLSDVAKELEGQLGIGKTEQPKLETLISAGEDLTKTTVQEAKP